MPERAEKSIQERLQRDTLIVKWLGYGVAFILVYFTLDDLNKPDASWWPGLVGALLFVGLGHLVSWAISRIPQQPRRD
ncbi:MAG TPA: hypothetical protein VMU46_07460 [Burkholderiales bacterium]|nr:hypothetical protein [Burkholderiales bacterium]